MKKLLLFLLIFICICESCKKYPDGPLISFRSAKTRIVGTWKVDKFFIDDIDSTDEFNAKLGCKFEFTGDISPLNSYEWEIKLLNYNNSIFKGLWEFSDNKNTELGMYFLSDTTFKNAIGSIGSDRTAIWQILRLTNKEFNLTNSNKYYSGNVLKKYLLNLKKQ